MESLRFLVLEEGLNDYRALKQLETYKGKEYVHTLIEKMAGMKITFSDYPRNAAFLLELRERVNKKSRNVCKRLTMRQILQMIED